MRIVKISSSVPENSYTTEEMIDRFPCKLPEGVTENALNLGVSKRSLVDVRSRAEKSESLLKETGLVDLCIDACKATIEKTDIDPRQIGYFITTYDANPVLSPGLSQLMTRRIGFDAYVKHVNAQGTASTAFPKALLLAQDHLAWHPHDNVLICVSGVSSYWFQSQVRGLKKVLDIHRINQIENRVERGKELRKWIATMEYFLFGDAAVAAIVGSNAEGVLVKKTTEVTNIRQRDCLAGYSRLSSFPRPFTFGLYSYLDKGIPSLGVKYTDLALKKLLGDKMEDTIKTSKKWAVHTGSQKILDAFSRHHNIDNARLKESQEVLKDHGNLSGASLPFILDRILSTNKLSKNDIIMMIGYGWGFSAAASLLEV